METQCHTVESNTERMAHICLESAAAQLKRTDGQTRVSGP